MATLTQKITLEFDIVSDRIAEIVEEEIVELHNDLIDAGQDVWDTGNFKNSFAPIQKYSAYSWRIENDAEYASILARGRRTVGGRAYGSLKWSGGIDPMIAGMESKIKERTDAL